MFVFSFLLKKWKELYYSSIVRVGWMIIGKEMELTVMIILINGFIIIKRKIINKYYREYCSFIKLKRL